MALTPAERTERMNNKNIDSYDLENQAHRVTPLGFNIPDFDEIVLSYTGTNLTGVVYKKLTVTVATLTLSYTGSVLIGVVKS